MESLGIGIGLTEIIIMLVVIGIPVLSLISLARSNLTGTQLALWALVICVVPLLGSLAYWIVRPTAEGKA